ncbi:AAA family ATPase [Natronococcus sp. A-GB7]|uniref:AAA family ATPase n=1 Tax=Natronococcus sp. A-GB7 TaxID=3037649 RepID=UPI00241CAF53|nr:AAA family ATPase [Natronococcus sp. A-GB7]MDG5818590.1 AAA family ATPase [Natronococcus sp. A-GB7]
MTGSADGVTTVEFFGVPGAGKSTIARRLTERLAATGRPVAEPTYELAHEVSSVRRYLSKSGYAAVGTLRQPRRALVGARAIADSGQPSGRALVKTTFNWQYVTGVLELRAPGELQVLDQGLVQAAWSVGLGAERDRTPSLCELAVDALSRGGTALVVVVDVAPETVRERLSRRADGDTRVSPTGDGHGVSEALERKERVERSLVDAVADEPSVDLLHVDNESRADLEDAVATVFERLEGERHGVSGR